MTINDIIAEANRYRPNHKASDAEIIKWLSRFDFKVKNDIHDWIEWFPWMKDFKGYESTVDRNTELLIREDQFEDLYRHYILAQIDLLQADMDSYKNERALCDEMYLNYQGWYVRKHHPRRRFTRLW